ncbi:MAG: 30S ribosomal protein S5 [Candidatus Pacebacteria bacterium]|nr:30S ribosomal protein S5 [Candidatus Paceibacterota bacterium]
MMKNTKFERKREKEEVKDEFDSKLLDLARVTKVTGGGKTMRFRAVMVAGNKTGKVGIGVSKGLDVSQAIEKATKAAKKNLKDIPIVNGTIPFEVEAKLGPSKVIIKPQKKGKGLVAGGTIRLICSLAGIEDVSSKSISRTKNKLNNARATMKALSKLNKK